MRSLSFHVIFDKSLLEAVSIEKEACCGDPTATECFLLIILNTLSVTFAFIFIFFDVIGTTSSTLLMRPRSRRHGEANVVFRSSFALNCLKREGQSADW